MKKFKMINCSADFTTEFKIDGKKNKDFKFKNGVLEAKTKEEINYFSDRPDFIDISASNEQAEQTIAEQNKLIDSLEKEVKELKKAYDDMEKKYQKVVGTEEKKGFFNK
jgi:hypothetical protein